MYSIKEPEPCIELKKNFNNKNNSEQVLKYLRAISLIFLKIYF